MNKIWLIIQREYLTRVKSRTFIFTTLLTPLAMVFFFGILGYLMSRGSDQEKIIIVKDSSNLLSQNLKKRGNLVFNFSEKSIGDLRQDYIDKKNNGIIEIPSITDIKSNTYDIVFHADDQLAIDESLIIERAIKSRIREYKVKELGLDESLLSSLDTDVSIQPKTIEKEKDISNMTAVVSSVLGGVMGYAMFFIIILYGTQVMRSVMEEKINRIVEVLISSVKPFQLMMGKVIGVGLVGLTQISFWILLLVVFSFVFGSLFGFDSASLKDVINTPQDIDMEGLIESNKDKIGIWYKEIMGLNWAFIIPLVLFYFFMGYFAYAGLFAAVGSAVGEDVNEANSLTLPVMLPMVAAVYIGLGAISAPNSSMAVWSSMIPLLSSIVMPVRLPTEPPVWQIAISMVSLILTTIFIIWLAARIYRVGILMYGKKASFKELFKWITYRT